jgi:hypothetical protein
VPIAGQRVSRSNSSHDHYFILRSKTLTILVFAPDIYCSKAFCIFIYLQSRMTNQLGNFEVGPNTITAATCEEANCEAGNPGDFVGCSGANRR